MLLSVTEKIYQNNYYLWMKYLKNPISYLCTSAHRIKQLLFILKDKVTGHTDFLLGWPSNLLFKNITSSFIFLRSKPNYNTGLCFFIASPHESMNMKHKLSNKTRHNSLKVIPIYVKIITPQQFVCAPLTVQKLPHSIVVLQIKANSAILSYFSGLSTIFKKFKPSKDNTADSTHGK